MCVLSIKVPIRKKSGKLLKAPRKLDFWVAIESPSTYLLGSKKLC